jgi:tRNA threonylcarbamoyladenosine modification (KEOPS) complex Cgi121 subunit
MAKQNNTILSKKIETDILLRFAGTTQINDAIKRVGIKNEDDFVIIAIGKKIQLNRIFRDIESLLNTTPLSKNNQNFLKKKFNITKKQMDAIISKSQLEDLLAEKAAILI